MPLSPPRTRPPLRRTRPGDPRLHGQPADDTPDEASQALTAYLRQTWHRRPWALAIAERQLRDYAENPPGACGCASGSSTRSPTSACPKTRSRQWLHCLADHLKRGLEEGEVPPLDTPATHWEWRARSPSWASSSEAGSRRTCRTSSTTTTRPSTTTEPPPTPSRRPARRRAARTPHARPRRVRLRPRRRRTGHGGRPSGTVFTQQLARTRRRPTRRPASTGPEQEPMRLEERGRRRPPARPPTR